MGGFRGRRAKRAWLDSRSRVEIATRSSGRTWRLTPSSNASCSPSSSERRRARDDRGREFVVLTLPGVAPARSMIDRRAPLVSSGAPGGRVRFVDGLG